MIILHSLTSISDDTIYIFRTSRKISLVRGLLLKDVQLLTFLACDICIFCKIIKISF